MRRKLHEFKKHLLHPEGSTCCSTDATQPRAQIRWWRPSMTCLLGESPHPARRPKSAPSYLFVKNFFFFPIQGVRVTNRRGWYSTVCLRRHTSPSRPSDLWSTTVRGFPLSTCTASPDSARCPRAADYYLWVNSKRSLSMTNMHFGLPGA